MSVTHVDFVSRKIISKPTFKAQSVVVTEDMFTKFDYSVQCIMARFGDNMVRHAPTGIFLQSFKGKKFDAYGYGNVHNSVHQYKDETSGNWNRPCPFPADLRAIASFLKKNAGGTVTLGDKSDAFMWMDLKYNMGKSILELANQYNVQLIINTMSDLIAHEDYATLVQQGGHVVKMQMGFEQPKKLMKGFEHIRFDSDEIERKVSPGAPSLLRRTQAVEKLKALGAAVRIVKTDVNDLTVKQKNFVNKVTGMYIQKLVV